MARALRLAERGLGRTSPNPAVGAVVVRDGVIAGEGFHQKTGTAHAEVHAISSAGEKAEGSTIYVTLEPCNHYGRTPPCTKAIVEAGVSRVVVGAMDPNPNIAGGGAGFLRSRGLEVQTGCMEDRCRLLIAPFAKHVTTGLPWVRTKAALSIDGRVATRTGESKWITSARARMLGHTLRAASDAILVGKNTVLLDDPRLTCRIKEKTAWGQAKDPIRFVLDSRLEIGINSRVLGETGRAVVVGSEAGVRLEKKEALEASGAEVWLMPPDRHGRPRMGDVLARMGESGIQSLLVEGGATIHGTFWDQGLVDEAFFFYAPVVIGGTDAPCSIGGHGAGHLDGAPRLKMISHRKIGDNWLVHGVVTDLDRFWRA